MSFDRLATVELQLVMHCCEQCTLLRLARCSRFTHHAASDPFAWRRMRTVAISSDLCTDVGPSTLHRVWQSLRSLGDPAAESPPSPLAVLRGSLLRYADADLLLRWTGTVVRDHKEREGLAAARTTLASLPRLRSLDICCTVELDAWNVITLLLPALGGLTALDISAVTVWSIRMRLVAQQLPHLRILRCRPAGEVCPSLLPLIALPLTDLGIVASEMQEYHSSANGILAECRGLRRLALSDNSDICESLLLGPALQQLRELSLAHLQLALYDALPAICANMTSLRRLSLDRCANAGDLLRAIATGSCPQLQRVRIGLLLPDDSRPLPTALHVHLRAESLAATISTLLERRPEVRVELRVGFQRAAVSATWLLPLWAVCDWMDVMPQWTDFEPLHPLRRKVHRWPLLFADDDLGRDAPLEED